MMRFFKYISAVGLFYVPTMALAATLTILPQTGTYKIGDTFSVGVYLNTEGDDSVAVDLELLYPSNLLEVFDTDDQKADVQITPGTLFPQNQLNTASGGRVRFAQLAPAGQKFSNTAPGLFAQISFRVIGSGIAPVSVEYTQGNTRDSNVAKLGGIDILSGVTNASFTLLGADGTVASGGSSYTFTRNLMVGSRGEDVRQLQKFLNANGFVIASAGDGSPGSETTFFGNLTKTALIRFQDTNKNEILTPVGLTRGSGYFGSSTRNKVHGLLRLTLPAQASPQAQSQMSQLQDQIRNAQEQVNRLLQQLQTIQGQ